MATPLQWLAVTLVATGCGVYVIALVYLRTDWLWLSLAALLALFVVIIVGDLKRVLLAVMVLDTSLSIDVHLGFRDDLTGSVPGLGISLTTLGLIAAYGVLCAELLVQKAPVTRHVGWLGPALPLVAYVFIAFLSLVVALDVELACFELFLLIQTVLLYIYVVLTVKTHRDITFVVVVLLLGLTLQSALMVYQVWVGGSIELGPLSARYTMDMRPSGTIGSPTSAAGYLGLFLVLPLGVLLAPVRQSLKWLALCALVLGSIAMIYSRSRGSWMGFGLALALVIPLFLTRFRVRLCTLIVLIVLVTLLAAGLYPVVQDRLTRSDQGSAEARLPLFKLAFAMINDKPLLGVGANNFSVAAPAYITPELSNEWIYVVHNKYLLVWCEVGLGGLVALLWFLGATLIRGWRCWQYDDRLLSPIGLTLAAGIAGHMLHMLVDVFNHRPEVQGLWLSAALITAMCLMGNKLGRVPFTLKSPFGSRSRDIAAVLPSLARTEIGRDRIFTRLPAPGVTSRQESITIPIVSEPAVLHRSAGRVVGNALSLLSSDVLNRAVIFILYLLVGRRLGSFAFGQLSLAFVLFFTFRVIAVHALKTFITREVAKDFSKTAHYVLLGSAAALVSSMIAMSMMAGLAIALQYGPSTRLIILLTSLALVPYSLAAICEAIFQAWEKMHLIAYANMSVNIAKVGLAYVLLAQDYGLRHIMLLVVVSFVAIATIEWCLLIRWIGFPRAKILPGMVPTLIRSAGVFFGINGIVAIKQSLTLILISKLTSETEVGLYSAATQFTALALMVYENLGLTVFPIMCRRFLSGLAALRTMAVILLELLLSITVPAVITLAVLAKPLLLFLYGHADFLEAAYPLQIVVWILLFRAFTQVFGQIMWASHQEKTDLRLITVNTVLWLVLSPVLISLFGAIGAAITLLITEASDFLLHYVLINRRFFPIPLLQISWKVLVAGAVLMAYLLSVGRYAFFLSVLSGILLYLVMLLGLAFSSAEHVKELKHKYLGIWLD